MDEVDSSFASNVLFELWRLSRAASALLSEPLTEAGMSGDEFGIYSVLSLTDGMSPTALAGWMSAPATTISSHLKRLEARKHLLRRMDRADGRAYVLELTSSGRRAFERAKKSYLPLLSRVEEQLGAKEPSIREALVTLRSAVEAAAQETTFQVGSSRQSRISQRQGKRRPQVLRP